ncbi:unnamed protein product [Brassicogethes aeneus]|uniref:DUF4371 domain-containing protein n=1 Tax=Brassicogethes aeneus TaxID=1431903 RepID=A0A9P0BD55_BRAAE|nr:unnamed protein product [Brassicogethes aeneus]
MESILSTQNNDIKSIKDHEKLSDHRKYFLQWKTLEARLRNSQCIDDELQKEKHLESKRWRHILQAVLNAIMFCAKNTLALRGSRTEIGTQENGVFLDIIELLSRYDKTLKELILNHKKYLSPQIQNEFINLLQKKVRNEILSRIQKSKYYGLLFDCTPDVSHNEKITEIISYFHIDNGKCLKNLLQELRDTEFKECFTRAIVLATTLKVRNVNKRSRKKKRLELYEGEYDAPEILENQQFRIDINEVDRFIVEIDWRYEKIMANDFGFLSGESMKNMCITELKKAAMNQQLTRKDFRFWLFYR